MRTDSPVRRLIMYFSQNKYLKILETEKKLSSFFILSDIEICQKPFKMSFQSNLFQHIEAKLKYMLQTPFLQERHRNNNPQLEIYRPSRTFAISVQRSEPNECLGWFLNCLGGIFKWIRIVH